MLSISNALKGVGPDKKESEERESLQKAYIGLASVYVKVADEERPA